MNYYYYPVLSVFIKSVLSFKNPLLLWLIGAVLSIFLGDKLLIALLLEGKNYLTYDAEGGQATVLTGNKSGILPPFLKKPWFII